MAYRIAILVASDRPEECVAPDRVGRLVERFGAREVGLPAPKGSSSFHMPFEQGADCYVEVDVGAELIAWYTGKFESEHGRSLDPVPNVFVSWTFSGEMDLELMYEVFDVFSPGTVVTPSDRYTGPELRPDLVAAAESSLCYALPGSLVALLRDCNGGVPARHCYPMSMPTSWADDHIEISAILGVGGRHGIYSDSGFDSDYMISEWEYPSIGIVICAMPSGGHDAVMLDYSKASWYGEPSVAYIDEDRVSRRIASSFPEFITGLRSSDEFDI